MTDMAKLADSRVEELIKKTLMKDSRIDLSEIQVRVQNGVVYISGTVDSAAERRAAREDLLAAVEPDQLVDELKLRNYVERTDAELCGAVRKALLRDIDLDARRVSIDACNGVVTLKGIVPSYAQKLGTENVTWWTPGVIEVINRLDVDGQTDPPDEPDY